MAPKVSIKQEQYKWKTVAEETIVGEWDFDCTKDGIRAPEEKKKE